MLAQVPHAAAPDSAPEALLVVAAVVLGLAYCLFLIARPGLGCLVTICTVLLFCAGYFPAVAFGAGRPAAACAGAAVTGTAGIVLFIVDRKLRRRAELARRAHHEAWERHARAPRSMDAMRQYWNSGE